MAKEIEFCIEQRIAVLSENDKGYILGLNVVSFGNNPAKLDLRRWKDGQPLKGISLADDEARALLTALEGVFADSARKETEEAGKMEGQHED